MSKKIYWCVCPEKKPDLNLIKKGGIPRRTNIICQDCGYSIFEEDTEGAKILHETNP